MNFVPLFVKMLLIKYKEDYIFMYISGRRMPFIMNNSLHNSVYIPRYILVSFCPQILHSELKSCSGNIFTLRFCLLKKKSQTGETVLDDAYDNFKLNHEMKG